jgi:phenylacetate-CoA ligase
MPFWDKKTETMKGSKLAALQLSRLRHTVRFCYERVPFYRKQFDSAGIKPADIKSLDDVEKIPFTTKQDLLDNYPFGLAAVSLEKVVRIHASSGTTGKPKIFPYTRKDLDTWAELMARELYMVGVTEKDVVQLIYNFSFFTGGFGFLQGAERIGAMVIPAGVGNTKRQLTVMKDLKTTAFSSTPSYALHIAEVMAEMGMKPADLSLRVGVFGSESWSEAMRRKIESGFDIDAYDNYGLSEMCGPGVCIECEEKDGMHLWCDHFLPEMIDADGKESDSGELVLTTLTKEGLPLLRYRTGDLTSFLGEDCACGRTHRKIARFKGRTDDMLKIKGVNVFPSQIESIALEFPEIGDNYQIIVSREDFLDKLVFKVEVSEDMFRGSEIALRDLKKRLEHELREGLGVSADVELMEPKSILRTEGKAKRVIDQRLM